jgi:hypothetical protein
LNHGAYEEASEVGRFAAALPLTFGLLPNMLNIDAEICWPFACCREGDATTGVERGSLPFSWDIRARDLECLFGEKRTCSRGFACSEDTDRTGDLAFLCPRGSAGPAPKGEGGGSWTSIVFFRT